MTPPAVLFPAKRPLLEPTVVVFLALPRTAEGRPAQQRSSSLKAPARRLRLPATVHPTTEKLPVSYTHLDVYKRQVGEHTAEPAHIDIEHSTALSLLPNGILSLFLGSDK